MLNGIGGRTIEEAKRRIDYAEFLDWCAYRKKYGPINVNRGLEYGFAMLASKFHNAFFEDKKKMSDFMPHYEEPVAGIADVMNILRGGK